MGCVCIFDNGCLPLGAFLSVAITIAALGLSGVLAFFVGYRICLVIPNFAMPPLPSGEQFYNFAVFGAFFSTAIFFVIVGSILYRLLKTKEDSFNKYERLRRRYRRWRSTAFALIVTGPFWGGMIGVISVLEDRNRNQNDNLRWGLDFGKAVVAGVIGGAVLLAALGGLLLLLITWKRARLSFKFTENQKRNPDPKPEPDVEKGKDVEGDQKDAEGSQKDVRELEAGKIRDVEYGRKIMGIESGQKNTDIEYGMQNTGIEYGSKDVQDDPPSNFVFDGDQKEVDDVQRDVGKSTDIKDSPKKDIPSNFMFD